MTIHIQCSAILFDMDGTLIDSTAIIERAWGRWAALHGLPLENVLRFSHGRPTLATMDHFRPGLDHAFEAADMLRREENITDGISAIPGAAEAVSAARKGHWGIVTSATRRLAEIRLAAAGLPIPRLLVTEEQLQFGKPDPEGYRFAAECLGVAPAECLVFEDTGPGVEAGSRAGMCVVGLLTTFAREQLPCERVVRDFRDVRVTPRETGFDVALNLST